MTTWKKVLLAGGVVLILLVTAMVAGPYLFRDQITERVRAAINDGVDARVDFGKVGISLFRDFPNLSFSLHDLSITGSGAFEGDTLAHVDRFRLVVDLGSAVRAYRSGDALVVRGVVVDRPYVHARVMPDGTANWSIMKAVDEAVDVVTPGEAAAPARGIRVALRGFTVNDARVVLDDERAGVHARVDGLSHELRGDFTRDRFTMDARTRADAVTVRHRGVPYLSGARLDVRAELDADMVARRFTFRDNRIALNDLTLGFDGSAAILADDALDLDLTFAAERAEFRDILSLVPALYTQDFASLEASGTVAVSGHARGRYGGEVVPAFAVNVDVADGAFRYADLPVPARDIVVRLAVTNPGGEADLTVVDLSRFGIAFGEDRFEATMALATPVTDPDVRLALNGRIDLGAVSRAVKLEGIEELRGTVTTDASLRARRSDVEAERYDRIEALGGIEARDVVARGDALPYPVDVEELRLVFSPRHAELVALSARVGASDFRATGRLDNVLGFALWGEVLTGSASVASRFIDLDEWIVENDEGLEIIPVPANLDVALTADVDRLRFGALEMTEARGAVRVRDERVTLDDFGMHTLGGDIVMSGFYETTDPARPTFDFDVAMAGLEIPGAFAAFNTVRALAPAAGFATGRFSADLRMNGALGSDMIPLLDVLTGLGSLRTAGVSLQGVPALHRLAEAARIDRLRDPALSDFATSLEIRDGRLHVQPFDVRVGGSRMNVGGSNGVDRSLDYRLALEVPRAELGADANRIVTGLLAESGRVGIDLEAADAVRLDAVVGGTMTAPTVRLDFGDALSSAATGARQQAEARLRAEADRRIEEAELRVEAARDEAREEARARARAEADRILAEAEEQATRIREEAARLAGTVRAEGHAQADRLMAEATTPLAQRAARPAADRIRRQADERADGIVAEADRRAEQVLAEARRRADAVTGADPSEPQGSPDPQGSPEP